LCSQIIRPSDMVIQLYMRFFYVCSIPTACFLFALNTLFWLIYNFDIKLEPGVINLIETCLKFPSLFITRDCAAWKMPEAWDKHGSQRNPEQEQEGGAWQYDTRRNMIKNPYIAGKPSAFSSEVVPKEKSLYIKCSVVHSFQQRWLPTRLLYQVYVAFARH
jgi:hypothetical protein